MHRFYWVVEGVLAGSSRPGAQGDLLDDLAQLRDKGIEAILSLTETPLDAWALDDFGMTTLHIPIEDMTAPQPVHFAEALRFVDEQTAAGRPVVVHCLAGQGRTGSILAAWLIRRGSSAQEALAHIRDMCPGAVENDDQVAALERYSRETPWLI